MGGYIGFVLGAFLPYDPSLRSSKPPWIGLQVLFCHLGGFIHGEL